MAQAVESRADVYIDFCRAHDIPAYLIVRFTMHELKWLLFQRHLINGQELHRRSCPADLPLPNEPVWVEVEEGDSPPRLAPGTRVRLRWTGKRGVPRARDRSLATVVRWDSLLRVVRVDGERRDWQIQRDQIASYRRGA